MKVEVEAILSETRFTEIIFNNFNNLIVEIDGKIKSHPSPFFSELEYDNFIDELCQDANAHCNVEYPFTQGRFRDFRLQICRQEVHLGSHSVSLRRLQSHSWSLEKLRENDWCTEEQFKTLQNLIQDKKNFLVVGPTSSGKTTVLSACLGLTKEHERTLILEDTNELSLPNKSSSKLVTRSDVNGSLPEIDLACLIKLSLRLRPDRIVVGEVRGGEAKSLLTALSTGHSGSAGTLHAADARQSLLRLEMLVQMGAPEWSSDLIRKLILLTVNSIVVCGFKNGQRRLLGIFNIFSLETSGFLLEQIC